MSEDEPESCKVVLIGESGVGKTSIISQFMEKEYNEAQESTPGATFSRKQISFPKYNKNISFEVWDTAGQEKYRALAKMFYKDASIAMLVYDITSQPSFNQLKSYWSIEVKENSNGHIILAIVANKSDLSDKEEVDEEQARIFAKELGASFSYTSAKTMEGIQELFDDVGIKFLELKGKLPNAEENYESNSQSIRKDNLKLSLEGQNKKRKCC